MLFANYFAGQGGRVPYVPASYIFDGNNEYLSAAQTIASTDRTRCTISYWMKTSSQPSGTSLNMIIGSSDLSLADYGAQIWYWDDDRALIAQSVTTGGSIIGRLIAPVPYIDNDGTWDHYVMIWDTNEAASSDRIKVYKNGVRVVPATYNAPGSSALFNLFAAATGLGVFPTLFVGNYPSNFNVAKRMAFIDVLDGIAIAPDSFAFDNGGTWTRKRYSGSYGTYGFKLDGTDGFNDVSGNGRAFTGNNMTVGANLDIADLPPYTN